MGQSANELYYAIQDIILKWDSFSNLAATIFDYWSI